MSCWRGSPTSRTAASRRSPANQLLQTLVAHLRELEAKLAELDRRLVTMARSEPMARLLGEIPGIGPVIATAFTATVPDPRAFASGRHLAASIGLVPKQHASGGQPRQLGISKRGDAYLRRQLIHGARSLVRIAKHHSGGLFTWIRELLARRPYNVAVVAVANKLARIIWAMLARGEAYRTA